MTAAVLPRPARTPSGVVPFVPAPRAAEAGSRNSAALAYQRVLHQMVRRELRLLVELTAWANADDAARAAELSRHADLLGRVLRQHHACERDLLWPAVFRGIPADDQDAARERIAGWTSRTAVLDHQLRDLSTVARQWGAIPTAPSHRAFTRAIGRVADAVDAASEAEQRELHPLVARYLPDSAWTTVSRTAKCGLAGVEQMLVLGLLLEDASAIDRARMLAGLTPAARTAWRLVGRRNFRAAVVRLRGAPPAG